MTFTSPAIWLRSHWIPPQEVRAEAWALGIRHHGRVVEGARLEGKVPGVSLRRAVLLKAVIRQEAGVATGRKSSPWAGGT